MLAKAKKKISKGRKTQKSVWRHIDHKDIEDTASFDVTQTLIDRVVDPKGTKNAEPFFHIDATGTSSKFSRSVKKDVNKIRKGNAKLSESHVRLIEKISSGEPKRKRTLKSELKKRALASAVFDVWDESKLTHLKGPKSFDEDRKIVPGLTLPLPGQSINPKREDHESMLLSSAAIELDKERKSFEFDRSVNPLTYALFDILPKQFVMSLNSIQKQQVFSFYNSLKLDKEETRISQVTQYIMDNFGLSVEDADALPSDEFLGLRIKNNVVLADSSDVDQEEIDSDTEVNCIVKKVPKAKTTATRNRFERHLQRLQEAAKERKQKKFLHSVTKIKEYLSEMKVHEEQLKARSEYRQAMAESLKEAKKNGVVIKLKFGKHVFQELPSDIIFHSDLIQSNGSLRKSKLSAVANSALKDRAHSIYRRGFIEAPPVMTPDQFYITKRQSYWKKKSVKFIVRH